jgi:hypothetical protein
VDKGEREENYKNRYIWKLYVYFYWIDASRGREWEDKARM